ncbi:hypothetical protein ACJX0J_008081, partial [Zea mays]
MKCPQAQPEGVAHLQDGVGLLTIHTGIAAMATAIKGHLFVTLPVGVIYIRTEKDSFKDGHETRGICI